MKDYFIRRYWSVEYYDTLEELIRMNWHIFIFDDLLTEIRVYTTYDHQLVPRSDIITCVQAIKRKRYLDHYGKRNYKFRNGPVPRSGIRRRYKSNMRGPKTKQELSQEVATRAKRKNLPTLYDDLLVLTHNDVKSESVFGDEDTSVYETDINQGPKEKYYKAKKALEEANGVKTHAAASLGISRSTLSRWLNDYEPDENTRRALAETTVSDCGGNKTAAAKKLGISRSALYRWLAE